MGVCAFCTQRNPERGPAKKAKTGTSLPQRKTHMDTGLQIRRRREIDAGDGSVGDGVGGRGGVDDVRGGG